MSSEDPSSSQPEADAPVDAKMSEDSVWDDDAPAAKPDDAVDEGIAVDDNEPKEASPVKPEKSASYHDDDDNDIVYIDHFSLRKPSSSVHYGNKNVHVYEFNNDQMLIEDDVDEESKKHQITVKRMRDGTFALRALRAVYTLISLLMLGVLFVFSTQVILFQLLEIPENDPTAENYSLDITRLVAAIFSLPVFIYSLANLLVIAVAFVGDTWNGHGLFAMMFNWSNVTTEWAAFITYICIPAIAAIVALFMSLENWWEVTALVWIIAVFIAFLVFAALVVYHEVKTCFDLMKTHYPKLGCMALIKKTLIVTLKQRFAGVKNEKYRVRANHKTMSTPDSQPVASFIGPYSRTTTWRCNCIFKPVDPPERCYSVQEIREMVPFVTKNSWSLEKMFCRNRESRTLFAIKGPDAVNRSMFASTVACTVIGIVLALLLVLAFLMFLGFGYVMVFLILVAILCCIVLPVLLSTTRLFLSMSHGERHSQEEEDSDDFDDDQALYQVWLQFTITKPHEWYCWFHFFFQVCVLFLWPMVTIFVSQLPKNGSMFLILGIFSGLRLYFDASLVLVELGTSISKANLGNSSESDKAKALVAQARTSEIMGKVTRSMGVYRWMAVIGLVALYGLYMVVSANGSGNATPQGGRATIRLLDDFYYEGTDDLAYPACKLTKGFDFSNDQGFSYSVDYMFLAALAYETPGVTDYLLDKWFGGIDVLVDETEFVNQWRIDNNVQGSGASWKLYSVPSLPGVGVVAIRGTETQQDNLLNYQLYLSSIMMQVVRAFMPLGWLFEPIYDDLIAAVSWISSHHLREAAYYRVTTDFVNDLLVNNYTYNGKSFNTLRTTGVSLGGGMALITGAQTNAYAVAFAGPNPTLARKTFYPPIDLEAINTHLINIYPEMDYISNIGDLPRNRQQLQCRAKSNCHSFFRNWCELMYSCGSQPRPVLCVCTDYGFPEPIQNGTRTFEEACAEEEAIASQFV